MNLLASLQNEMCWPINGTKAIQFVCKLLSYQCWVIKVITLSCLQYNTRNLGRRVNKFCPIKKWVGAILGVWLPGWLDSGRVYMEWDGDFGLWWLAFLWLWGVGRGGGGAGRWQNLPVEFEGHQHRSLPMQRPPLRQGIWQKTAKIEDREQRNKGYKWEKP